MGAEKGMWPSHFRVFRVFRGSCFGRDCWRSRLKAELRSEITSCRRSRTRVGRSGTGELGSLRADVGQKSGTSSRTPYAASPRRAGKARLRQWIIRRVKAVLFRRRRYGNRKRPTGRSGSTVFANLSCDLCLSWFLSSELSHALTPTRRQRSGMNRRKQREQRKGCGPLSCVSCLSWFLFWARLLGKPPEGGTTNVEDTRYRRSRIGVGRSGTRELGCLRAAVGQKAGTSSRTPYAASPRRAGKDRKRPIHLLAQRACLGDARARTSSKRKRVGPSRTRNEVTENARSTCWRCVLVWGTHERVQARSASEWVR